MWILLFICEYVSKTGMFGQINYSMDMYDLNCKLFWNYIFSNQFQRNS